MDKTGIKTDDRSAPELDKYKSNAYASMTDQASPTLCF